MSWGFEEGRVYNRREDIHARFGGQRQSGIITPSQHPLVVAFTGSTGRQHGYEDAWLPDGSFEYFGEGQVGDMTMSGGNAAIANHSADGESLLLFEKVRDGYRFVGEMVCEAVLERNSPDQRGDIRRAFVFRMRRMEAIVEAVEASATELATDISDLRRKAYEAAGVRAPRPGTRPRNVYERSADVRNYVLGRAKGHCEGCGQIAPFRRPDGSPYLEPHHIRRVSDGGPDHPAFVIALCPNCHRRVHAGSDGPTYNTALLAAMSGIERKIWV